MVGRLGRREHFDELRAHGVTLREGKLRVRSCLPAASSEPVGAAVAWSIGRAQGGAVRRNRIRRRLREIMRAADEEGRVPQRWYLVTVLPTAAEPTWGQLSTWMDEALVRAAELPDTRGIPSRTQDAGTDRGPS